jgi:O-antigen ligase
MTAPTSAESLSIPDRIAGVSGAAARWAAVAIGFAIPISVAADNVLIALAVLLWLASGRIAEVRDIVRTNGFARASWLLLVALLLGVAWGYGNWADGLHYVGKYKELIAVPVLIMLFQSAAHRNFALRGFSAAMTITLLLSYLIALKVDPVAHFFNHPDQNATNPFVFKLHLTHNLLMALGAYLWALKAGDTRTGRWRFIFGVLAMAAAYNVLFMVQGRTGQVVLLVLGFYWCYSVFRIRGIATAAVIAGILISIGWMTSAPFVSKMRLAAEEVSHWQPGQGTKKSSERRLNYYTNTIAIILDHPWLGVGSGGFERAYGEKVRGTTMESSDNPHNQYLLITAQLGLGGLGLLLYLLYQHWRLALRLTNTVERRLAVGLLLLMATGCLFNSMMIDHTERFLFIWLSCVLFGGHETPVGNSA